MFPGFFFYFNQILCIINVGGRVAKIIAHIYLALRQSVHLDISPDRKADIFFSVTKGSYPI